MIAMVVSCSSVRMRMMIDMPRFSWYHLNQEAVMEFAEKLTIEILRINKSQRVIAESIGVPLRTLEDWKAGRRVPPKFTQDAILDALKKINPSE